MVFLFEGVWVLENEAVSLVILIQTEKELLFLLLVKTKYYYFYKQEDKRSAEKRLGVILFYLSPNKKEQSLKMQFTL